MGQKDEGRPSGDATFSVAASSVLIPSSSFQPLTFAEHLDTGTQLKLFKGEVFGTVCRHEDDPYLCYVVSGHIDALFLRTDGTHMRLYERGAGNAFQFEFAGIASQGATRLQFCATENSIVVSWTFRQVRDLVASDPRAFEDLITLTHLTYGQLGHRLDNVDAQSTSRRILVWLKKLVDTAEPDADGTYHIDCDMTVQEISDLLMIHVTTCSRLLAALKRRGIAERTRKQIVVSDPDELARLCLEENPLLY
ncbi:MAG: Crp/Fnr family transcriptional regulator [Coriobacteriia bacterium]|nr:Crp/Fnr family transcriptional regulator [Coriobacteriia bacterium]MBS5477771.1 Crp/Fnr family transcriptional regulator [Coriobacteriia bacterium]